MIKLYHCSLLKIQTGHLARFADGCAVAQVGATAFNYMALPILNNIHLGITVKSSVASSTVIKRTPLDL